MKISQSQFIRLVAEIRQPFVPSRFHTVSELASQRLKFEEQQLIKLLDLASQSQHLTHARKQSGVWNRRLAVVKKMQARLALREPALTRPSSEQTAQETPALRHEDCAVVVLA